MLREILAKVLPPSVRSLIKDLLRMPQVERSVALDGEIQFWRKWLSTKGMYWPDDFRARFDPDRPIGGHLAAYVDRVDAASVRILDVGSGPLTKLGKTHPSKRLEITASDLLAADYDRLLAEFAIVPPVRTVYADAERLVETFGANAFDIAHGQNCVDHTSDPQRAIEQMVAVTKPGGWVVLYHAENEGQREHYDQLHQWNFTCEDGSFIIRDRAGRTVNMTHRLAATCDVECRRVGESPSAVPDGMKEADVPREARPDAAILTGIHKRASQRDAPLEGEADMAKPAKNTICLWYDRDAEGAARFYAKTFPDSSVDAVHLAPGDFPSGKKGDVLTVDFTVLGVPCMGLNGGPEFKHNEAFSFQVATVDQAETDRYWNAIVGNGGQESACGWCKDKWGVSWQITPIALTKAITDPDPAAAKRAFDAMMEMGKIDIAAIEAARRG